MSVLPMKSEAAAPAAVFRAQMLALRRAAAQVIVGQDDAVMGVLTAVLAGGHALIEGPPGVGKTLVVKTLTRLLGLSSARIQFTPDLLPSDILGGAGVAREPNGVETLVFRPGPIFANVVLADELNRSSPRTQAAFLEAMEERQVTALGATHRLSEPFTVLATQNPLDEGTYPLPGSQLDRFLLHIRVEHPGREDMARILERDTPAELERVSAQLDAPELLELREIAREVLVAPELREAVAAIVDATNPAGALAPESVKEALLAPVSPRSALALLACARVHAAAAGRHHLCEDDLRQTAVPVLRHRLALDPLAESHGLTSERLVSEAVSAALARR